MENLVERAKLFAIAAHGEQRYGNDRPYSYHLEQAIAVAEDNGVTDPEILAAVWLHDVVEDTPTTIEEVTAAFGARVASIVESVTDVPNEPGKPPMNRKTRKQLTYQKTRNNHDGITVKLCDRIANVQACVKDGNKRLFKMYADENDDFLLKIGLRQIVVRPSHRFMAVTLCNLIDNGRFKLA